MILSPAGWQSRTISPLFSKISVTYEHIGPVVRVSRPFSRCQRDYTRVTPASVRRINALLSAYGVPQLDISTEIPAAAVPSEIGGAPAGEPSEFCGHGLKRNQCALCCGSARARRHTHRVNADKPKSKRKHSAPPAWRPDARADVTPASEPPTEQEMNAALRADEFASRDEAAAAWEQILADEPSGDADRKAYWLRPDLVEWIDKIYSFLGASEPEPRVVEMLRTRQAYYPVKWQSGDTIYVAREQIEVRAEGRTITFRVRDVAGREHALAHDLGANEWREVGR